VHKRSRDIAANLRRRSGDAKDEVAAINADLATIATTKGKPSTTRRAFERRRSFRRLVKWRTGSEGRISCLKRDFGWNRTLMDEIDTPAPGAATAFFNHNLVKIAGLMVET